MSPLCKNISRRAFIAQAAPMAVGFFGLASALRCGAQFIGEAPRPDPKGLLDLPLGFSYHMFSPTGEIMTDGTPVPALHDGMGAFPVSKHVVALVRNHEVSTIKDHGAKASGYGALAQTGLVYDNGKGENPSLGGTTTLLYDTKRKGLLAHFRSLAGTQRNCAGGRTPWGSWLTCEEDVRRQKGTAERNHGYVFEVPVNTKPRLAKPIPLTAMGRFNHEAVSVDPTTGVVYLTEDRSDSLLYRFIPKSKQRLHDGGRLQALAIADQKQCDTRNRTPTINEGAIHAVHWVDLEDIQAPKDDLRYRGRELAGAAIFGRCEGIEYGSDGIYICSTNGGPKGLGQVWRYHPSPHEGQPDEHRQPGKLELFSEPNDQNLLQNGDNVTVAPWGDLIICEDGPDGNRLLGLTPKRRYYVIAVNRLNGSEFAGSTFAPDGSTLFVNLQSPGLTLAITGPWPKKG